MRLVGLGRLVRSDPSVRAVIWLTLVMVVATVVSASAFLWDLRAKHLAHARGEVVSLSRILAEQSARTFEGVSLVMYGTRERLADPFISKLDLDSPLIQSMLQARISGLPQVKSLFVVDERGRVVNSSRLDFPRHLSVVERDFFHHFLVQGKADDGLYLGRPEHARVDGQWTFYTSLRMVDEAGRFRGVLAAAISIGYFESLYQGIDLDLVGRIRLLDWDGALLAGNPRETDGLGRSGGDPEILARLRGQVGDVAVTRAREDDGYWLVAYRPVSGHPLTVSVAGKESEILAAWWRDMAPIVVGIGLVLLSISGIAFVLVRSLLRKAALEGALRESDERLRQMVQSVTDAIVTINGQGAVVLFNGAAEIMFGLAAAQAIGCSSETLFPGVLGDAQWGELRRKLMAGFARGSGALSRGSIELRRGDDVLPAEYNLSCISFRGELFQTAVFRDFSERKRAEEELRASNRQLQELSAALQNVREEERGRISRELHDELGQLLTGIRMEVSWLGSRLGPSEELLPKVAEIKERIDQTIQAVRRLSSELRPLVLDDLGFSAAASWYVKQYIGRTGLDVILHLAEEDPSRGGAVALCLFRIIQEALTNVARHADARKVEIRVEFREDSWVLSVSDDGRGFDSTRPNAGFGLVGARERVQILRGTFRLTSVPGRGTRIEVTIPAERQ